MNASGGAPEQEPGAPLQLSPEELREVLALEATWACLTSVRLPGFLEATMRRYRIPPADMALFTSRRNFRREDVWKLQVLKRMAENKNGAVQILARLHQMEQQLGEGILQVYLERSIQGAARGGKHR